MADDPEHWDDNESRDETVPPMLPSRGVYLLAFASVVIAGLLGGIIGYGIADVGSDSDAAKFVGTLLGSVIAAGGVGIVAVLVLRAASGSRWDGVTFRAAGAAVAFAAVYGITDEFHQWFVPGRTADVNDWMADCTGAAIAVAVVLLVARFARERWNHRFHR